MKKILWLLVCLMTMVSANAQLYRAGSRAGNRMANYAHSMKRFSIQQNAKYAASNSRSRVTTGDDIYYKPQPKEKGTTSFWDKQQMFSIGVTVGSVYKGDKSYFYYGADFVIAGAFMGLTLSDTSCEEKDDYSLNTGFQFGYFFPVCKFGKKDGLRDNGWDNALLISPLVEFSQILNVDGHHLHEGDIHHNCKVWIDTSYTTTGKTGFGAAVMYRFSYGTLIGKFTTTSVGISLGFGL